MEIREFAERVLHATTLADKLAPPSGPLTDYSPGKAILAPGLPGRPPDLLPRRQGEEKAAFPTVARLVDENSRARLLHFFCNHELLAVELMALALLRFPDAPASFRKGVARTLQEEQEHTRWYATRMAECGLRFGDLPVSRMIWDRIAPMESPLEFVSRLSLTFEQSNLDYARHYTTVLGQAGDAASAAILDRIYHDEIAHVGHGLKWLRRWKEEKESDWDAFRRGLKFPLSPVRAKGLVAFNAEGRRKAGLDEDFIRRLEVFEQSRGRTPDLWWFHPAAEDEWAAVQSGRSWHENQRVAALAADLEPAFALVAPREDVVLMRRPPSEAHRARLAGAGLHFPETIAIEDTGSLKERRFHAPRPWAWTPGVTRFLAGLPARFNQSASPTPADWFSKATASKISAVLPADLQPPMARLAADSAEAEGIAARWHEEGWPVVVAKSVFGVAGRGHRFHRHGHPPPPSGPGQWLVEPWLPRVLDFSAHYDVRGDSLRWVGFARQSIDSHGRWLSSSSGPKFLLGLAPDLAAFANRILLPTYEGLVIDALAERLRDSPFHGPLGIDAFIWRDKDDQPRLHAVVEANPRWTMGRVAMALGKKLNPQRWLTLRLAALSELDSLPPPVFENGRMTSGALVLTDPAQSSGRLAVATIGLSPG